MSKRIKLSSEIDAGDEIETYDVVGIFQIYYKDFNLKKNIKFREKVWFNNELKQVQQVSTPVGS